MPVYEYQCEDCGCKLEVVQNYHDDPLTDCDECFTKNALRRLLFAPHVSVRKGLNDMKTVGDYASKKTDLMSRGEYDDKIGNRQTSYEKRKKSNDVKLGNKQKKPWWRKTDKPDMKLADLTPKQQNDYITKGKADGSS